MEEDENTSGLILDTIDFTPCLFFGFTATELACCFLVSLVLCSIPLTILSGMCTKTILYGFVGGAVCATVISFFAAQKAQILKKDRPSYMMWYDLMRFVQDKGVFGIKINMRMVGDQVWEIEKSEDKR